MPLGNRTPGVASGPPTMPRLLGPADHGGPITGLEFVASRYETESRATDPADASGDASVRFGPVPLNEVWLVERVAISSDSSQPTIATLYLGSKDPRNQLDQTGSGNSDLADNINPLLIPSGSSLLIEWNSVESGKQGFARIQFKAGALKNVRVD